MQIFPCSFNFCVLKCFKENGHGVCTLFDLKTMNTEYVQINIKPWFFEIDEGETELQGDVSDNRITVIDIVKLNGKSYSNKTPDEKYKVMKELFCEYGIIDYSKPNKYTIDPPVLFDVEHVDFVFDMIIPNFYRRVCGVMIFGENLNVENNNNIMSKEFIVKKTKLPEIYGVFVNETTPVHGNNILYICSSKIAEKINLMFDNKNAIKLKCKFDDTRQRWFPVFL